MRYLMAAVLCSILFSCTQEPFTPKPRGYYKVHFPERAYQQFQQAGFPYSFEYPVYGRIVHDSSEAEQNAENPYWINVDFPELGGRIYLSYKRIGPQQSLDKLLEDAHKLSFFHTKKADYINDAFFKNRYGVNGIFFEVGGDAATAYQFVATDSARHFLRGALYFEVTPNADSLRPVNDFLRQDMEHMLQTLQWHN